MCVGTNTAACKRAANFRDDDGDHGGCGDGGDGGDGGGVGSVADSLWRSSSVSLYLRGPTASPPWNPHWNRCGLPSTHRGQEGSEEVTVF